MSRRAKKIEKRVSVDPKFNSELIAHVIRVIMKDGKKTTAERIVYGAVDKIKDEVILKLVLHSSLAQTFCSGFD